MKTWKVYLLTCADGVSYAGCTNNFDERLERHNNGHIKFTQSRLPVSVVLTTVFTNKYKAYDFEKYLKSDSGRDSPWIPG